MASVKESSGDHASVGFDDDDIRGDGKKKRFKPLSAMRKFFGKKRKKEDSVVAVKAQSTTALHSGYRDGYDTEDDDGGFKNHQKPVSLGGNRSISQDSIFSPEHREANISPFPKSAVSEESLPKSAFQSELLSKLNKRRSQYSDDDHDDGLPRSPIPPVTTADVIMGGPLKPGTSGKKTNNRDSDQSLISVDSSENEEEDLFQSKWKSSVATTKKSTGLISPTSSNFSMDLDLNSVQKTELLTNIAAKDKISVKPKRAKASRKSGKKRDTSSPQSLPSLNEESPTGSQPEDVKSSWVPGSPIKKETVQVSKHEPPVSSSTVSSSRAPLSSVDNKSGQNQGGSAKPNTSSIKVGAKVDKPSILSKPVTSTAAPASIPVSSAAVPPAATSAAKVTTPTSPSTKVAPHTTAGGASYSASQSQSVSSPTASISVTSTTSAGPSIKEKKASETISTSDKGPEKISVTGTSGSAPSTKPDQGQKGEDGEMPSVDVKSRLFRFQPPSSASNKSGTSSAPSETPALKVTEPDSKVTLSPKEDYKQRRQVRSKTLPAATDEQSSPKVPQRSSSHRDQTSTASSETVEDAKPSEPEKAQTAAASTIGVKKLSNVKFASVDSPGSTPSEPAWKSMIRKRQEEQGTESDSSKGATSTDDKVSGEIGGANTSAPKPAFSSSSYLEKKRGSVETVSYKGREVSEQSTKKGDVSSSDNISKQPIAEMSPAKRPSVDMGSSKRPSIDISSTKRESIEIDISELSSVKALRNSFTPGNKGDPSSKSANLKDSKPNVPSAVSATSDNLKPSAVSTGISPFRGGSVKTAPTASVEVKSAFPPRGGSIKGGSSFSSTMGSNLPSTSAAATTTSSSSSSSVLTKAESGSASKPDNTGSSSAPSSSAPPPSSAHASQPTTSLPSHTPSVTSSATTPSTKPMYSAFSSRPYTNPASSAFRPTSTFTQPTPKPSAAAATTAPAAPIAATTTTTPTPTPTPVASVGVKSASSSVGVKTFPASNVKPLASTSSIASNIISAPASTSSNVVSTSSSSSSSSSTSSSTTTTSPSRSSSVRSHSSFNTSTAFKPQISSTSPTLSSRTSSVTKSPSFKSTTNPVKTSLEEKKAETPSKVPAWRANLKMQDVKIEIIENAPTSSSSSSSSQSKSENLSKVAETAKKSESTSGIQTDKTSNRSSKVLDMVKNFQNLQVSS